jgi:hypothetical protein
MGRIFLLLSTAMLVVSSAEAKPVFKIAPVVLRPGTYNVTRNNTHAHLSSKKLQQQGGDRQLEVKGDQMTFGKGNGVFEGMTVTLKNRGGVLTGTGSKIEAGGVRKDVEVTVENNAYRGSHAGLKSVTVKEELTRGFTKLSSSTSGGAAWRFSSGNSFKLGRRSQPQQ